MTKGAPHVVIVGVGFGGLSAARALAGAPVRITLIDRRNHHLFQPLLYQVATAGLSPSEIAQPIRSIVRGQANTSVLLAEVTGVDADARTVLLGDRRIAYDHLMLATGARHAYFGHDEWEAHAPGLKRIEDATEIRRRILTAFEAAESMDDPAARRSLLTFVVVGGGPTGVELAGAIVELARRALAADFRAIDPRQTRVVLVEAGERVLPAFPESLSAAAHRALERLGVEVRLGTPVTDVDADSVRIGGVLIATRTIIWAAGVAASPAARWLGVAGDRSGRIVVAPDLTVPGRPEIFAIGDTASIAGRDGRPLPGVAPVAKQQGRHVAAAIRLRLAGRPAPPFRYRHFGNMATIGRKAAVADFGRIRLSGLPAWLLWGAAHVYFLIGFRNRLAVVLNWLWAYATFQNGSRLITGSTIKNR
ncbi:MAG: NAD(P)/FAD-dependent oxidoreductase [Alphaproteobacteria bacterium]|nr:NAD(P)/FAD-dependent oxidoreductase [Alphaproteobacteria bacterium]